MYCERIFIIFFAVDEGGAFMRSVFRSQKPRKLKVEYFWRINSMTLHIEVIASSLLW